MHSPVDSFLRNIKYCITAITPLFSLECTNGMWNKLVSLEVSTLKTQLRLIGQIKDWSFSLVCLTIRPDFGPLPSFIFLDFTCEHKSSSSIESEKQNKERYCNNSFLYNLHSLYCDETFIRVDNMITCANTRLKWVMYVCIIVYIYFIHKVVVKLIFDTTLIIDKWHKII